MTVGEAALALQDRIMGRTSVATNPPVKVTIDAASVAARVLGEKIDQFLLGERARMGSQQDDDGGNGGKLWTQGTPAIDTAAMSARARREMQEAIFRDEMRRLEAQQYGTKTRIAAPLVDGGSAALAAEDARIRRERSAGAQAPPARLNQVDEMRAAALAAMDADRRARAMNGSPARGAEAIERARALGDPDDFVKNLERIARGELAVARPATADEEDAWQAARADIERARRDADPSRQVWPALRKVEVRRLDEPLLVNPNGVAFTSESTFGMQPPLDTNGGVYITEGDAEKFMRSARYARADGATIVRMGQVDARGRFVTDPNLRRDATISMTAPDGWLIDNVARELVHMDTSRRISLMALFAVPPADIPDMLARTLAGRPAPVPTGSTAAPAIEQLEGKRRIRLTDEE